VERAAGNGARVNIPVAVFKARAEARALLWKCCDFDLLDAVE
jgi:hypothetical protein